MGRATIPTAEFTGLKDGDLVVGHKTWEYVGGLLVDVDSCDHFNQQADGSDLCADCGVEEAEHR